VDVGASPSSATSRQELLVALAEPLDPDAAEEFARLVFFVDESIEEFELAYSPDGKVTGVQVMVADPGEGQQERLGRQFNALLSGDFSRRAPAAGRTLWQVAGAHQPTDVFDDLVASGSAFRSAQGQVAIGGPMLTALEFLDARLRDLACSYGAVEYRYPTLLPTSVIESCGYLDSFPHLIMFVSRLRGNAGEYERFGAARRGGAAVEDVALRFARDAGHCLPPTMCFHTYHQYAGRRLAAGSNAVVTSRGKAFRFESRYARGLERLWDFTLRETVFLGSRDFVRSSRRRMMDDVRALLEDLGLAAYCTVGNDPFFAQPGRGTKIALQVLAETKYELRMPLDDRRTVAVGSFNYADDFFTNRFDIRYDDGSAARTGCVGFGLERLAYAFLCQHGLDPRAWPAAVADCPR
jgi:hypothetical protein